MRSRPTGRSAGSARAPTQAFRRVICYIDTIAVVLRAPLTKEVLTNLRGQCGPRLLGPRPIDIPGYRWFLEVNQPRPRELAYLQSIGSDAFSVCRVDVAIDFICADRSSAAHIQEFLAHHVVQKWHGRRIAKRYKGTTDYWSDKRMVPRNIALYSDRLSKTNSAPCAHFELRFFTADSCRRAGLGDLGRLMEGVDIVKLLNHQTRVVKINSKKVVRSVENAARKRKLTQPREKRQVSKIRNKTLNVLARALQSADHTPPPGDFSLVSAQRFYEYRPYFRGHIVQLTTWAELLGKWEWFTWDD